MRNIPLIFKSLIFLIFIFGCSKEYSPKPRAYFRIDLPQKKYRIIDSIFPYSFEIPAYATIEKDTEKTSEAFWTNIHFNTLNAKIHISYKSIQRNPEGYTEDSHILAYKHSIKADAIDEKFFENKEKKTYGILYEIKGNAASSVQFFLTDSTKHFIRGSLYFFTHPNKDSLAPVVEFLKKDIIHLIETLKWK